MAKRIRIYYKYFWGLILIIGISWLVYTKLIPLKVYHYSEDTVWGIYVREIKDSCLIDKKKTKVDTTYSKSFIIEGYISQDTSSIKKIINNFLDTTRDITLSNKNYSYDINFYKSFPFIFTKNHQIDNTNDWSAFDLIDFEDFKIANLSIFFGKISYITFFNNSKITYIEGYFKDGAFSREKFKNGKPFILDTYSPQGKLISSVNEKNE